jgi:hypothetical protein
VKRIYFWGIIFLLDMGVFVCSEAQTKQIPISKERLFDKIKGGWVAKTIGCTYGGPVEFVYNGTMIQDYTPIQWSKDRVKYYYDSFPGLYDDLYVDIVFINVLDKFGLDAPADTFATTFANMKFPLWHANQVARYNISHGIKPSGHWLNNPHADDIDYQIEADFAGLTSPGMVNNASALSDKVGHLFNYGDGWYGGVYVGALYASAFLSDNMEWIVENALRTIPIQSDFYKCIRDIITWHKLYPNDWKRTWFECQKKWSSEIGCPDGVFEPLDIDAKINSGYVTIGLLYGNKNFYKTIDIASRCGQDADCNAATSGGILGTVLGYSNIPERFRESVYEVMDRPFAYTDVSLNKLCNISFNLALKAIEKEGGNVNGSQLYIKKETPQTVRYEKSFSNHYPTGKVSVNSMLRDKVNTSFNGIGFVQKGYVKCSKDENYSATVELYIDGTLVETGKLPSVTDNCINNRRPDLFYHYQLPNGNHQIEYKWLNPRNDAEIYLGDIIVYSNQPRKCSYNN